jgi:tRNA (guanine37-N1)-methyltransferase
MMRIDILTLFPSMFHNILKSSILKIAIEKSILDIRISNIRNFSYTKHHTVDDTPYGGGAGMLLKPEPILRAVESIFHSPGVVPIRILLTPQGETFQQKIAVELSKEKHLILICGHYEGFDERIRIGLQPREISIGDYILTGGEIPAMVILDAVSRLIPGVLGSPESIERESFSNNLLEYPQYTKPPVYRNMEVPEILLSGHHQKIQEWREKMAYEKTSQKRSDLLNS